MDQGGDDEFAFVDARIGDEFVTGTGRWRITDKGTRTIVAIKLEDPFRIVHHDGETGPGREREIGYEEAALRGWFDGPPYAVAEHVFDSEEGGLRRPASSRRERG